jgi:hypothetical protein
MLEYGLRFLAGGIAVSAFAALGDTLRPKSFRGPRVWSGPSLFPKGFLVFFRLGPARFTTRLTLALLLPVFFAS